MQFLSFSLDDEVELYYVCTQTVFKQRHQNQETANERDGASGERRFNSGSRNFPNKTTNNNIFILLF